MPTTAVDIPMLDLGPYLAGGRNTARRAAAALRHALEEVGFYYAVNDHPPRYEPTTYERYLAWFTDGNYRAETSARP